MSSLINLDDDAVELEDSIAKRIGSSTERVIKLAIFLMAIDVGLRVELPRKEKEHAG